MPAKKEKSPHPPKLSVELIPVSSWGLNLSKLLPKPKWDELRQAAYARAGHRCEICTGVGPRHPVECHEVWQFEPATKTQRLVRLIALCPDCHSVKHFGRLGSLPTEYRIRAYRHLSRVNGWAKRQADAYIAAARSEWLVCCKTHWKVDTSFIGLQVDTGASRGELLVTETGTQPTAAGSWTHLGDLVDLAVSVWRRS